MFETGRLTEASYLFSLGHPPSCVRQNGGDMLLFEFGTLDEQTALRLLASKEFSLCETFHRSLRLLRQRMDTVQGRGPRR